MPAQAWVTLGAAMAAAAIAVFTLVQKHRSDNRKEWWTRFQFALAATYSQNEDERDDGWLVVNDLNQSKLITTTEAGLSKLIARKRVQSDNEGESRSDVRDPSATTDDDQGT